MRKQAQIAALSILTICLAACGAVVDSEGFKVGSPSEFAKATHIARLSQESVAATQQAVNIEATRETSKINAQATTSAAQAKATATAAAWQAESTRTAWALSVQATETAAPYNASRVKAAADTEIADRWTLSLALAGGLAVALLLGLALVAWLRTRAKLAYPNKAGQMPLVLQGNAVLEPNRTLGAGTITPGRPGVLWTVARLVHYLKTGEVLELPTQKLELADGHATADHYLAAAKGASQVAAAAAIFQPDNAQKGRQAKVEMLTTGKGRGLLETNTPTTRVVATGDEAIRAIARQLGDNIPQLAPPAPPSDPGWKVEEEQK
jgi:hypothetical protein